MVKINPKLAKALSIVSSNKSNNKRKAEKVNVTAALADMQDFLDNCNEKREEFLRVVLNEVDKITGEKIRDKGLIVYARRVNTINNLLELIKERGDGIECKRITGAEKASKRSEVEKWFKEKPFNKIVFISDAGGASLNLNSTNYLILYTIPTSYRKFSQIIGRVARGFGKFSVFNILTIIVEGTLDEYSKELLSSRSSIEEDLLHCNTIPVGKHKSYNLNLFKRVRAVKLWRYNQRKKNKNT